MIPQPSAQQSLDNLLHCDQHQARSAYVHVPFCRHRCGYCDFAIVAGRNDLVPRYLQALEQELILEFGPNPSPVILETLYLGGGTPTLLSPSELQQLLALLHRFFTVTPETEFTFEANPDGFTAEKQDLLRAEGVNRISLGVQSFDANSLRLLERTHSSEETLQVIEQIRHRFANFSLDLIFALPGQTHTHWLETLQQAIQQHSQHISTYALTFEKGTTFWGQREKGFLQQTHEAAEAEMYEATLSVLRETGFEQYEISNFSQPGYHSRHNEVYWTGKPYFAFGPGASRFLDGVRKTNHRSTFTWLKRLENRQSPVDVIDELTSEERARELLAIGLRRNKGVSRAMIFDRTGQNVANLLPEELASLIRRGWLQETETHYRLTEQGRLFADAIAAEVI